MSTHPEEEPLIWTPGSDAPFPVRSVIPKTGFWTGNNNLGHQVEFDPDSTNRQSVLKLDEWGPPELWTVMLGIDYKANTNKNSMGFEVVAECEIGVGGTTQKVLVDWNCGVAFSAVMNAINITAFYGLYTGFTIPDGLILRASICRGGVSCGRPTRSVFTTLATTESTGPIEIPPFTRRVFVMTQKSFYIATSSLIFLKDALSTSPADVVNIVAGDNILSYSNGVPIPGIAKYVNVDNEGPDAIKLSIIFEIGL